MIAAGSTGSIPAAAELLATVASLDEGAVVLPGFAGFMDDASWNAIDDSHPQRAMKALITRIGIDRKQVRDWPLSDKKHWPGRAAEARTRLVTEALRPADETADWLARLDSLGKQWKGDIMAEGLRGLSVIEAREPASEARAIALALRHTLDTPGRTAMVVTPDRALGRRITTEMARFDIQLDDSAGQALSDTAPGSFLVRVLEAAIDPGSALTLVALWASPLFTLGRSRPALMAALTRLEARRLRGRRPGQGLADVRALLGADDPALWRVLLDELEAGLAPLLALQGQQKVQVWAEALAQAAETLARGETRSGAERMWSGRPEIMPPCYCASSLTRPAPCHLSVYGRFYVCFWKLRARDGCGRALAVIRVWPCWGHWKRDFCMPIWWCWRASMKASGRRLSAMIPSCRAACARRPACRRPNAGSACRPTISPSWPLPLRSS